MHEILSILVRKKKEKLSHVNGKGNSLLCNLFICRFTKGVSGISQDTKICTHFSLEYASIIKENLILKSLGADNNLTATLAESTLRGDQY